MQIGWWTLTCRDILRRDDTSGDVRVITVGWRLELPVVVLYEVVRNVEGAQARARDEATCFVSRA